jgi:hypothetical protein
MKEEDDLRPPEGKMEISDDEKEEEKPKKTSKKGKKNVTQAPEKNSRKKDFFSGLY